MTIYVELADLKAGDEVPQGAIIRELYLPYWDEKGMHLVRVTNVPVEALTLTP